MTHITKLRAGGIAAIAFVVLAAFFVTTLSSPPSPSTSGSGTTAPAGAAATKPMPGMSGPQPLQYGATLPSHPFPGGRPASEQETDQTLAACGCPGPRPADESGPEGVIERWRQGKSNVGIVLRNTMWITYTQDSRTHEQYADDVRQSIDEGFWNAKLVRSRGVSAAATSRSDSASAYLAWIEGDHLIEIFGFGGQSLEELLEFADDMGP